ncbi:MAG TPA: hypothetical protein VGM76_10235 [Lacipirellulaceae bacterium]
MMRFSRIGPLVVATVFGSSMASSLSYGGTIIKLDLVGGSEPSSASDFSYDGTTLGTLGDGNLSSPGDQDTAVSFQDVLSGQTPIMSPLGSFNLHGLTKSGSANLPPMSGLVIQNFSGGTFQLYGSGPAYQLLLQGMLTTSAIAGPIGAPATGGLFTSNFASITGGSLAGQLNPSTLTLAMSLGNIGNGAGFVISGGVLQSFVADATLTMTGTRAVPEPSSALLVLVGSLIFAFATQQLKRR